MQVILLYDLDVRLKTRVPVGALNKLGCIRFLCADLWGARLAAVERVIARVQRGSWKEEDLQGRIGHLWWVWKLAAQTTLPILPAPFCYSQNSDICASWHVKV